MTQNAEPLLLRMEEVAQALNIGRSHAYALVLAGTIPSIRLGRSRRVPLAALERWIADQAAGSGTPDRR